MDPLRWAISIFRNESQWPAFSLLACLHVFIIMSLLIEKMIHRKYINGFVGLAMIVGNLTLCLVTPTTVIWNEDLNPLVSVPILMAYCTVFLKLWSYAAVNNWCRVYGVKIEALKNERKARASLKKRRNSTEETSSCMDSSSLCSSTSSSLSEMSHLVDDEQQQTPKKTVENLEQELRHRNINKNKSANDKKTSSPIRQSNHASDQYNITSIKSTTQNNKTTQHSLKYQLCDPTKSRRRASSALIGRHSSGVYYVDFDHKQSKKCGCWVPQDLPNLANLHSWQGGGLVEQLDAKENPELFSLPIIVARLNQQYPDNLTLRDIYYFMIAPTLCYEINFPRVLTIRKRFVLKRLVELIFLPQLMICLVQQWLLPILDNNRQSFAEPQTLFTMLERLFRMAIPNHLIWLLGFYVLFHSALNLLAELLMFGDRLFYKDWWNAETVASFWSTWNIPVHRWARRHIYKPLLRSGFTRFKAGIVVFFISAVLHEFLASVPLKMVRMWAFFGMIFQVPYAYLVHLCCPEGGNIGNIAVWLTLIIGQPLAVLMYLNDYYLQMSEKEKAFVP